MRSYPRAEAVKTAPVNIDAVITAIRSGRIRDLGEHIGNDLEAPVIKEYPVIEDIKNKMYDHGAFAALMTGSGSAVFGLFGSEEEAAACAAALKTLSFVAHSADRHS